MNGLFRKKAIYKCWVLLFSFSFFQSLKCENLQAPASEPHLWDMYIWVYDVTRSSCFLCTFSSHQWPFLHPAHCNSILLKSGWIAGQNFIHSAKNGNCVIYSHSSCSKPAWISTLEHDIQQKKELIQVPYLAWTADVCLIKKAAVSEQ